MLTYPFFQTPGGMNRPLRWRRGGRGEKLKMQRVLPPPDWNYLLFVLSVISAALAQRAVQSALDQCSQLTTILFPARKGRSVLQPLNNGWKKLKKRARLARHGEIRSRTRHKISIIARHWEIAPETPVSAARHVKLR